MNKNRNLLTFYVKKGIQKNWMPLLNNEDENYLKDLRPSSSLTHPA